MPFDHLHFAIQTLRDFKRTGALMPSSPFLATAMTRCLEERPRRPIRVLEAGPGTGAFTERLVRQLGKGDSLECWELNPGFVARLQGRFEREPQFRRRACQLTLVQGDILDLPKGRRFDYILCSLPFNNFPPSLVKSIMDRLTQALKPGGCLTYFEYLMMRKAKTATAVGRERARLARTEAILEAYRGLGPTRDEVVWLNLFPALVRCIHKR
jgi:phospholipid N-methyltransferase